jgi:hypothetical protein
MRTIAEYRKFAVECRELAAKLTDPRDKHALELMAAGWDKVVREREAALEENVQQKPPIASQLDGPRS